MPSSKQRLEVWRGLRAKTSGGLRKEDLVKNKRGKIVSKRKSEQAGAQNNLGDFLRKEGTKVPKDKMLYKKGAKPPSSPKKAAAPKKKAAAPKKTAAPKKAAAAAPKKKAAAPKKAAPKKKAKSKINPVTKQPYAKKSASGFVENSKVHLDNLKKGKRKDKPKAVAPTKQEVEDSWAEW